MLRKNFKLKRFCSCQECCNGPAEYGRAAEKRWWQNDIQPELDETNEH